MGRAVLEPVILVQCLCSSESVLSCTVPMCVVPLVLNMVHYMHHLQSHTISVGMVLITCTNIIIGVWSSCDNILKKL